MDIPLISSLRFRGRRVGATSLALAVMLIAGSGIAVGGVTDVAPDVGVKAALLYNFAKFAEWPGLPVGAPIAFCIVGDDAIAAALVETVHGRNINGHALDISRPRGSPWWGSCHVLFVAAAETQRSTNGLEAIKGLPVLTVSDGKDFSHAGGIIELYVEGGRMRFAINVDAAEQSGVRLSSRLLGLAKIIRNGPH